MGPSSPSYFYLRSQWSLKKYALVRTREQAIPRFRFYLARDKNQVEPELSAHEKAFPTIN